MILMETDFITWLQAELDERGWNRAMLAREADIKESSIADLFSRRRNPGPELLTAIADALKVPQEVAYRAAGLLREKKNANETVEKIVRELEGMSKQEQQEYLAYIRWHNNRKKK